VAKSKGNINDNTAPALIQTIYRGNATTRFIHNESNYVLEPGQAYDLPADCNYVQALVAQQILQTLN
jgi:hypothetical protein